MLEGLVAAGFFCIFHGNGRRAVLTGIGAAGLTAVGVLFPGVRFIVLVLTALWMMLMGALFQTRQWEELLLSGGVWLLACGLGGIMAGDVMGQYIAAVQTGQSQLGSQQPGILQVQDAGLAQLGLWQDSLWRADGLQAAIATAFFAMVILYLLGRGRLYPLWLAALAMMWALAGFLGSIPYAEPWQTQVMAISLYAAVGGILIFQQLTCVRQELERAKWDGRAARYGISESWFAEALKGLRTGNRVERGKTAGEPEAVERASGNPGFEESKRRDAETEKAPGIVSGFSRARNWREAAAQEYRQLQIFEHDFRHHLDVIAALYEEGCPKEALGYMEDLKQARVSRQGRRIGGERELSYIMLAKREACRQAQISFSYQIVGSPRGIAQMDMAALLLNLLDNAIRACQEAPHPRSIGVMLLSRGELWEIEMVNTGRYEPGKAGQGTVAEETASGKRTPSDADIEGKTKAGVRSETGTRPKVGARLETGTRPKAGVRSETGTRPKVGARLETGTRPKVGAKSETGVRSKTGARPEAGAERRLHGIGLVSVRQIVEKYQGTYRIWQEAGQVRQKLILVQRGSREDLWEPGDAE